MAGGLFSLAFHRAMLSCKNSLDNLLPTSNSLPGKWCGEQEHTSIGLPNRLGLVVHRWAGYPTSAPVQS